jgi:hypothetical protein
MLRIPHCTNNRLTDGGKSVSLTHRPRSTPQKHFLVLISVRGWANPRAKVRMGGVGKLKYFNDIANRTLDFLYCSIVPQSTRHSIGSRVHNRLKIRASFNWEEFAIQELTSSNLGQRLNTQTANSQYAVHNAAGRSDHFRSVITSDHFKTKWSCFFALRPDAE